MSGALAPRESSLQDTGEGLGVRQAGHRVPNPKSLPPASVCPNEGPKGAADIPVVSP